MRVSTASRKRHAPATGEQTPAVVAGLPEGQLDAEANHVVGGYQALEPGREFPALDWVAEQ
jgi:hypothetical protein